VNLKNSCVFPHTRIEKFFETDPSGRRQYGETDGDEGVIFHGILPERTNLSWGEVKIYK